MIINWKILASIVAIVIGILTAIPTWIALGLPVVATRAYVDDRLKPIQLRQAKIWRQAAGADLATWRIANPNPDQNAKEHIERLLREIVELDRRIETFGE